MLPVPATLNYVNKSPEALGLLPLVAVSPITPTSAEQAEWSRLKSGVAYQAEVLEQTVRVHNKNNDQHNTKTLANNVLSRVQLQQADGENVQMWMMLPTGLAGKSLQLQFAGKPNQTNPQVKWALAGESGLKQMAVNPSVLSAISHLGLDEEGTLPNSHIQAASVQLSDTAKTLHAWRESSLFPTQTQTYEAREIVSLHPEKPQVLAQDLKHALQASGLFYESHLKNASLGTQTWHSLLQEPQNQAQFTPASMVAQQLQVLEQQRIIWHGEVWPGQSMTWQVVDADHHTPQHQPEETVSAMQSSLTLRLPNLGEVRVNLALVDGHLQVQMQAEQEQTLKKMQTAKMSLAMSMVDAGLKLEGLSVRPLEQAHVFE